MAAQLVLPVGLRDDAGFDNFVVGSGNRAGVDSVVSWLAAGAGVLFLHGPRGSGKSHLLHAALLDLHEHDGGGAYLPLRELHAFPPAELLPGLEANRLVAVDDLEAVAGRDDWEEALFHLHNRCLETAARLVFTSRLPPAACGIRLGDLRSRLLAGLVVPLQELDDDGKRHALLARAQQRGMHMDVETADFILRRSVRDMQALVDLLGRLDAASLAAKRRLSIPFVKSVLGW